MGTAYSVILRARGILQDLDGNQWSDEELLAHVSAGQTMIAQTPDGCTAKRAVQLVAGHRQQLPADCLALMGISRNLGTDGVTFGTVVFPIDLGQLSAFDPSWESGTGSATITGFSYQPELPKEFVVYPPATAGIYVEAAMRVNPAPIPYDDADAWQSTMLSINAKYEEALLEFVLFRAYSKDSEDSQNLARANLHQQAFSSLIGGKPARPPQQQQSAPPAGGDQ